ncbi:MAG TPA: glycosyl hydrolase, partial [Thermoanaerobaculia bacterium]|nr:glycosyl hydrolase [Thermoanaerobaculia bacterium]
LWTGSDDGLIHVSRDGGGHWDNVTPPKSIMPEWIMINEIDASPFDKGTAYVAATMYKSDDFHPYLYKTNDYGKTWTKIVEGLPSNDFTRVIRSDTKRKGLLFAGTEHAVFVSFDDGAHWESLQYKLPTTPISDLLVHDDSLIAATSGRGFWMLDDIEPLRQLTPEVASKPAYLFTPTMTWRTEGGGRRGGGGRGGAATEGQNPPNGVIVDYIVNAKPKTKVSLAFLGADGKVIREFKGEVQAEPVKPRELSGAPAASPASAAPKKEEEPKEAVKSEGGAAEQQPSEQAEAREEEDEFRPGGQNDKLTDVVSGHNRFAWDLRTPDAKKFPGMILWAGGTTGVRVLPGTYTVKLTVGDQSMTAPFEVRQDPRTSASAADLKAQYDFVTSTLAKLSEVNEQIIKIRDVRKQLTDVKKRVGSAKESKPIVDAANDLDKKMTAVEEALYQTKNHSPEDPLNFPIKLNDKLAGVADSAATGSWAPTAQQVAVRDELVPQIDAQLAKLKAIWDTDLPAFNKLAATVPAVNVTEKEKK